MSAVSIEVNDTQITSTATDHSARSTQDGGWEVSWLPGRVLGRDTATSSMLLVDTVASGLSLDDPRWPAIDAWAREIGLSGPEAVVRASTSDEVRARIARAEAAEARPHLYGVTDPDEKAAIHYEDEAIDFEQLDPVEQERQIDERLEYEDKLQAAKVDAAVRAARADAVPMTGPVEQSAAGEAWSQRVDAAVHGFDAADPGELDLWMQAHAESDTPHLREADLVAAWETRHSGGAAWDHRLTEHERTATGDAYATSDAAAVCD